MDKVDCTVLHSETSQCPLIKADVSRTINDVKLTAVREMQEQISDLAPGAELDPSFTDFYPGKCMLACWCFPKLTGRSGYGR